MSVATWRLLDLVAAHPTADDLAGACRVDVATARIYLRRLLRAGLVTRTRRGGSPAYHYTRVDFARMSLGALELPR